MRRATLKENLKPEQLQRDRHNELAIDFMTIELELADTFCKLALQSHSPERARQHTLNARKALNAALDALTKAEMKEKELEGMITKIEEVKALVESLEAGGSSNARC